MIAIRKTAFLALATLVLVAGLVILYFGFNNFAIRSFALLLCVGSTYLVKIARRDGTAMANGKDIDRASATRPGTVAWVLSGVALVILGLSFAFLYRDALNGYHDVWPVYAFGASIIICAIVWPYVIAKLIR